MNRLELVLEPVRRLLLVGRRPVPPPRVEVATGSYVSAWLLRLVVVGPLVGSVALVARSQGVWLVALVLLVGAAARPDGLAPSLLAGMVGVLLVTAPAAPFHPRVFALVFMVHLALELGALVGPLPFEARVEWRVLGRGAPGFLAIQAVAQTLALLGAWATGQPPAMPWLPLMAAAALAVLTWSVTARLRESL
ncbi:MAG TPA: hypothetical protein VK906_07945 [Egicoccus sp.]|nr:hypothetical protein [Egicoccus sp.]HSK23090.1 hypothetical protein [Egicoccus sp.]